MNIAVFVSGNGTNLQALINAERKEGLSGGKIALVVSNKPEAYALGRAKAAGIKTFVLEKKGFASREEYDKKTLERLRKEDIELVVLAGFMRILSAGFIDEYADRIINIHPSLLPDFKGAHGIKDAFEAGAGTTGVTVHFVAEELDSGPVILQEEVKIEQEDTLERLEEKIHKVEHKLYPKAVRLFVEGKLKVEGKKVKIKGE